MARFERKDVLNYPIRYYQYSDAARAWIDDPVSEYRQLRKTALNRIYKMEKAGKGDYVQVQQMKAFLSEKPSDLSRIQAADKLPDLARFIVSERGTLGGIRAIESKTVQTLKDKGLDFVNQSNIRQFGQFMDKLRADKKDREYYYRRSGKYHKKGSLNRQKLAAAFKRYQRTHK